MKLKNLRNILIDEFLNNEMIIDEIKFADRDKIYISNDSIILNDDRSMVDVLKNDINLIFDMNPAVDRISIYLDPTKDPLINPESIKYASCSIRRVRNIGVDEGDEMYNYGISVKSYKYDVVK